MLGARLGALVVRRLTVVFAVDAAAVEAVATLGVFDVRFGFVGEAGGDAGAVVEAFLFFDRVFIPVDTDDRACSSSFTELLSEMTIT